MLLSAYMLVLLSTLSATRGQVVVHTRSGALSGTTRHVPSVVDGSSVGIDIFYGIPYAQPPLGDLRFARPVAAGPWTGIRNASAPGPMCPQPPFPPFIIFSKEDCLSLNVFSPKTPGAAQDKPVMFFIHGGAFQFGGGAMFDGAQLASMGLVVVTVNYRLGALGFLCTEDSASPGNYALYDVVLALQWVRDNIRAFGGDPDNVIIFGESAGAALTSLLTISTESKGLFTKAITESGGSLAPWAIGLPTTEPKPWKGSMALSDRLGCPTQDRLRLVNCLRTRSINSILEVQAALDLENEQRLTFRPVVEAAFGYQAGFLAATPEVLLRTGRFNNVSVVHGCNQNEGAYGMDSLDPTDVGMSLQAFTNMTKAFVKKAVLRAFPSLDLNDVMGRVLDTYVTRPGVTDPRALRDTYIQIITDFDYFAPVYKELLLQNQAHGAAEYQYLFTFRSANRLGPHYMGVPHTDELFYVFGYPMNNLTLLPNFVSNWTDEDIAMTTQLMTLWSSFARQSIPSWRESAGHSWLPWTQVTPRYLNIKLQSEMDYAPQSPGMYLWNYVIPSLVTATTPLSHSTLGQLVG